jgi:RNA polymerase sigma-70 factor (ECF subfamily)
MATEVLSDFEQWTVGQLVRAAQAGNRCAFGELFQRYERQVFGIALRRLGDVADAEEVCQDVFTQVLQKLEQLRVPECFGAWLTSIAHRMAINFAVRRPVTQSVEEDALPASFDDCETPLGKLLAGERRVQIRDGLERLGAMDRETLVAFYITGQTLLEMSDAFNVPLGTVKRRLHVARKRLAEQVEAPLAI